MTEKRWMRNIKIEDYIPEVTGFFYLGCKIMKDRWNNAEIKKEWHNQGSAFMAEMKSGSVKYGYKN